MLAKETIQLPGTKEKPVRKTLSFLHQNSQ